ncbi:GNAT family protein [Pseudoduganella ginsengisoli]|uniref:GNAT family N-acetyltransferase n=1 Tax=Pseudoduganella ginsengisoli TaxID=1462440 RepID=A0A6L6Q2Z7_9BURK|nr:GNAT family protein [Pseudoduganella ginsengisoli]MTW04253.1 GNAT family N-acetyltransferase [Pseudoduganella ginsengisoli]
MPIALPNEITTTRLILRQPRASDAAALFDAYTQDAEVARYMVWVPHKSVKETEGFIAYCCEAWSSGKSRPYVMSLQSAPHRPIGILEARLHSHMIDLGYVLAREHWGAGLMPEAVGTLAEIALADPSCFRVQATCDVENIASARTLEKAGFALEAKLQRYTMHPNISAAPRACFMYANCR